VDTQDSAKPKTVYIASDHGGFELKNYLMEKLVAKGFKVEDLGFKTYDPKDDYPDLMVGLSLACNPRRRELSSTEADNIPQPPILDQEYQKQGPKSTIPTIIICKNGVGVSVLANKIDGVRCALSFNPEHARSARRDDDINFLALPADYITKEVALETALAFLETPFSNEERHVRRLEKLEEIASLRSQ